MFGAGAAFGVIIAVTAILVIILWWWHSYERGGNHRANTQTQHRQNVPLKDSLEVTDDDETDLELGLSPIEKPRKVYQSPPGRASPPNSWTRLDGKERPRIYEVPELGGRFVVVQGLNGSI